VRIPNISLQVTAIFVNIFGGIVRCDAIAQGLISVVKSMSLRIPIIARLQGTNMEQAHQLVGFPFSFSSSFAFPSAETNARFFI
jgi:hypothetical protein